MRTAFAWLRLALATLGIVALIGDFLYTLGFRAFFIANYFGYFTTQSNMAGVVLLTLSGLVALRREWEPRWLSSVRAVVLCYVIVSGIVFGLIAAESNARSIRLDIPWSSAILHFWIPTLSILDWIFAPGRRPVPWRTIPWTIAFPVVWGVVTLIRGASTGWYPYFFLDPGQVSFPFEFAMYAAIVLVLFAGITAFVASLSRIRPLGTSRAVGGLDRRLRAAAASRSTRPRRPAAARARERG